MRVITSSYWFPNSRTRKWTILGGQGGWRRRGKFTFENIWRLEYIFYLFFSYSNYRSDYGPYNTMYTYGQTEQKDTWQAVNV